MISSKNKTDKHDGRSKNTTGKNSLHLNLNSLSIRERFSWRCFFFLEIVLRGRLCRLVRVC